MQNAKQRQFITFAVQSSSLYGSSAFSGSNWIFLSKNYFLRFELFLFICHLWLCLFVVFARFEDLEIKNELNLKIENAFLPGLNSVPKLRTRIGTKQKPHNENAAKHKSKIG